MDDKIICLLNNLYIKIYIRYDKPLNFKYHIINSDSIRVYCDPNFCKKDIAKYIEKHKDEILFKIDIKRKKNLLDFNKENILIENNKFNIIWNKNSHKRDYYEVINNNIYIHSADSDFYSVKKKNILKILRELGSKNANVNIKNIFKKYKLLLDFRLVIVNKCDSWCYVDHKNNVIFLSCISFTLPKIVFEYLILLNGFKLNLNKNYFECTKKIDKLFINNEYIKDILRINY